MNKNIVIRNLTIKNILNLGKALIFIFFIFYCVFKIGLGDSGVLRNLLIFLYASGAILTISLINYFSEVVIIDENGIKKSSLFFSHFIEWSNIRSVDVQLTTANRLTKTLDKTEYFDNFYVGRKEILISNMENQLSI
ncbi:hypothetical protein IQ05_00096 [Flavobacterium tiangeerense]|uniref:PH (Pleckstrin Homology) domain-containing protein n=1 Tax=Flavobacterium tiangeerense TaxID=459471 RepID=A0ABY3FMX2_9FLAO|nr:hypothetical protein [Flavobacterium tiangeerense]TWI03167.1 hypothetical protein IQ05_00096 [Flavobacterium tiangeerense]